MHIEILNIVSHVGYLIIGIVIAFWAKLTKSNSKSNFDKKAIKILWWTGCIMSGCAGGVLVFFKIPKTLIIIISMIIITILTAIISTLIEKIVKKEVR